MVQQRERRSFCFQCEFFLRGELLEKDRWSFPELELVKKLVFAVLLLTVPTNHCERKAGTGSREFVKGQPR